VDEYVYLALAPYMVVAAGVMLAPFASRAWPNSLVRFVDYCSTMANGTWAGGIAFVILLTIGVPFVVSAVLSWPVLYFAGLAVSRISDGWHADSLRRKRMYADKRKLIAKNKQNDGGS
jgi:hypothetical protein